MAFVQMVIQQEWVDLNGDPANGFVLKAYLPGTTTSTSMFIDDTGSSPQTSITLNAKGLYEVSGNLILPYIDRDHKWALFLNATDAAANTNPFAGFYDNVPLGDVDTHINVNDEGIEVTANATAVNFKGAGVTAVNNGGTTDVTVPGNIESLTFTKFTFTVNATHTPTAGTKALEIIAVGGCGGGGGVDGQGASTAGAGSSGGGGGTVFLDTTTIDASYVIVIGASGVGGAAGDNDGTAGGNTTVTSSSQTITANGGAQGLGMTGTATDDNALGGAGSSGTGGDYVIQGGDGNTSIVSDADNTTYSKGGSTFFGGGIQKFGQGAGTTGVGAGCGGLGGRVGTVSTNFAGGDGEIGKVLIKEIK